MATIQEKLMEVRSNIPNRFSSIQFAWQLVVPILTLGKLGFSFIDIVDTNL